MGISSITEETLTKTRGQEMLVVAGLANRGSAEALLYFTCEVSETGMEADIGGYRQARIGPGESVEVSFGWRHSQTGIHLLPADTAPTQLVSDDGFGGGSDDRNNYLVRTYR